MYIYNVHVYSVPVYIMINVYILLFCSQYSGSYGPYGYRQGGGGGSGGGGVGNNWYQPYG